MLGWTILTFAFAGWCFMWYWIGYKLTEVYLNWRTRRMYINATAKLMYVEQKTSSRPTLVTAGV